MILLPVDCHQPDHLVLDLLPGGECRDRVVARPHEKVDDLFLDDPRARLPLCAKLDQHFVVALLDPVVLRFAELFDQQAHRARDKRLHAEGCELGRRVRAQRNVTPGLFPRVAGRVAVRRLVAAMATEAAGLDRARDVNRVVVPLRLDVPDDSGANLRLLVAPERERDRVNLAARRALGGPLLLIALPE